MREKKKKRVKLSCFFISLPCKRLWTGAAVQQLQYTLLSWNSPVCKRNRERVMTGHVTCSVNTFNSKHRVPTESQLEQKTSNTDRHISLIYTECCYINVADTLRVYVG